MLALCSAPFAFAPAAAPPLLAQGQLAPAQTGQQGGQTSGQQPPGPRPGSYILRSQTNVVLVDVRVWDKSGKAVTDLKPGDFKVTEDGAPQTITSFSLENVEQLATASADNGPPPTIDLAKLPPATPPAQVSKMLQDHRLIVLFFDMSSMPVDDLMRAEKSAADFVHSRLTPADLVAVATYSSDLRVVQNFTNDRDALSKALKSIQLGEASSLADAGTIGEAGGTDANGAEVVTQDVSAAFTPDETEFNIFNTDEKLAAIESLADLLRGVPGRKSVIHFSSGIERTGVENQAQLRATTDAANQANVSLYTVDARGLAALPPGGDATSASPAGTAVYSGSAVASQVSGLQGSRETLATLATDTGGRDFYDLNDFAPAFRAVQAENSTYYLIGYSPSNTKSDGRFRRIKVEVDRPGIKVQARPGYFAPKDFRQFSREDKELQLEQAMQLDEPFVDLPMAIEASYFRQADGRFYVVLAAKIPGSSVSFLSRSQNHQTEFDFAWRVNDSAGHPAAALRDTLPVKLDPATYQQVISGNFLYEGGIVLPAGKYQLKVVARENQSGRLGTFEEPLVLPDASAPGLGLSSVVVSNQLQDAAASRGRSRRTAGQVPNPLEQGSRSVLPSVTRVFRTDQKLYVYLESYAAKAAKEASDNSSAPAAVPLSPSVALVFFRGRIKISEAGPYPGKVERAEKKGVPGPAHYFVEIPLAKFPPGRYFMQVNVLDPAADQVAFARVPIAIMRAQVQAAPAAGSGK
ncbi:MAG TPA: VWA domain-containing protein [Terriglobia bacterium]|nr:VWA domain-containing protein [Terriglobia bacterium]